MTPAPPIIIRSEEEAWAALEAALDGRLQDVQHVQFDGWPQFKLDVRGHDWHSTVPTRIMPALLDVQRDLHRAYTSLRYDEANLRRLRNEERDTLEVVVKVEKGSSAFSADLWDQLTELAKVAIGRMNGTEATITVLGVALAIAAPVMWKAWLHSRVKEKQIAANLERERADLASRVEMSKLEQDRLALMARVLAAHPVVQAVQEDANATANQLLKASRPGDVLERGGVQLAAHEAQALVQPERERAKELELQGVFRILGNRTDQGDGFRITVQRDGDDESFNAHVPMALAHDQKALIQRAEWSKGRVSLWIAAERLRETIVRAEVTKAAALDA